MLDLDREDLDAVFTRAAALAAAELDATRCGPVFASAPSAANLHAVLDEPLPVDGEPLDDVLEACEAVLAAGRRTAPGFFGYVQSPPTAVGVIADLLASAADQNVTAWRSAPAAVHVERPFRRCGMGRRRCPGGAEAALRCRLGRHDGHRRGRPARPCGRCGG